MDSEVEIFSTFEEGDIRPIYFRNKSYTFRTKQVIGNCLQKHQVLIDQGFVLQNFEQYLLIGTRQDSNGRRLRPAKTM